MIRVSAPTICATLAASLSLSPYFISAVAVVSFSFTIGIAFNLKRFSKVLLTFKARLLCSVSSGLIKICPDFILNLSKIMRIHILKKFMINYLLFINLEELEFF